MKTAVQFTTINKAAPVCPVAPAQTCPAVPFVECKPGPAVLKCPPAPDVLKCPPAPKICSAGPITPCASGPGQGWEDPRDWVDPIFEYRYIEDLGHVLVLVRKSQLKVKGPAGAAATAAEAAEYGYDQVYWSYNAADMKTSDQNSASETQPQPSGEFKPAAQKRKR